ncbi:N-acetylmuramoyl-L-alanine amidase [Romboutsia sp.]|uniref:N-acetylmuramoyl-L-alanine amidase n=1 Tax=Romboutsia sp. TaxID=1965302 RepID=UPI002BCD5817|nr:N-acetylmuramoyl-L-alanine amidase [Romboutsia sp.]HSQ87507.1 N-acetylmuramoyl-L-alanine amidase [Romboutsia sp.]
MIKYKRIGLFVGHSKLKDGRYTSSQGIKNEYFVNKELATETKKWLDSIGQPNDLIIVPEGKYTSSTYEDNYKLPIANSGKYDLIVEFHANSYNGKADGSEVLYHSTAGKTVAKRVQNKLGTMFDDRGLVYRSNLYMLRDTHPTAIMIESFFIDSAIDCAKYDKIGKKEVARRIAEGLVDTTIKEQVKESFEIGAFQKNVVLTSNLNCRRGRGSEYGILKTFSKGTVVNVWYIDKAKDGSLWGSCNSGIKDSKGKSITGFIHMGYTKVQ